MLKIIEVIRNSFSNSVDVYTTGRCYQFHLILKSICPYAEPWYDGVVGHVYTKIGEKFYDINGELEDKYTINTLYDLRTEPRILANAEEWGCDKVGIN
jgi:hypothetical protein